MVRVTAAFRHRGIATRLLRDAMAALQAQGRTPMLDATPAGAAVYRPLGFRDVLSMRRWQGRGREGPPSRLRQAMVTDVPMLAELDAQAFGASRPFLMASFLARLGTRALIGEGGFVVRRSGFRADQIGPLVAPDEASAATLLAAALDAAPGPVFIDLLEGREPLARMLSGRGFEVQRPFHRVGLATATRSGDPAAMS